MKRILALMLVMIIGVISAACGSESEDNTTMADKSNVTAEDVTETESDADTEVFVKEAMAAYHKILEEKKDAINGYYYQYGVEDYVNDLDYSEEAGEMVLNGEAENKCIAIEDVNGDKIPELLFMAAEDPQYAGLNVYTYDPDNQKAVNCEYSIDSEFFPEGKLIDSSNVTGLSTYMIYVGHHDTFYIATATGQASRCYQITEFKINSDGEMIVVGDVKNKYESYPDEEGNPIVEDVYSLNGESVSEDEGAKVFTEFRDDYSQLLMFSGYEELMSVFEKVKTDEPAAMSFSDAITKTDN